VYGWFVVLQADSPSTHPGNYRGHSWSPTRSLCFPFFGPLVRWLSAGTERRPDQVFLRPGARVRANTDILRLSNADVVREIADAELAMKKSEAELANLRVQLQAQLLNERALEAQLESEATQAQLEAERDESPYAAQLGTAMSAKISRARADSLAARLKIEREKLGIAEEAREAS
jgi:HlyD family secretion protein